MLECDTITKHPQPTTNISKDTNTKIFRNHTRKSPIIYNDIELEFIVLGLYNFYFLSAGCLSALPPGSDWGQRQVCSALGPGEGSRHQVRRETYSLIFLAPKAQGVVCLSGIYYIKEH